MTFEKYLRMIKKYLKNTNRTWEKCDEFYGNLRYEMPITRRDLKKINFFSKFKIVKIYDKN